jgi:hypothetical protein
MKALNRASHQGISVRIARQRCRIVSLQDDRRQHLRIRHRRASLTYEAIQQAMPRLRVTTVVGACAVLIDCVGP